MDPFDLVVQAPEPSSLAGALEAVESSHEPGRGLVFIVGGRLPPPLEASGSGVDPVGLPSCRPGTAADRNVGLRASRAEWIVFLDRDAAPRPGWPEGITADIARARPDVAVTGAAYRRDALARLDGFDERLRTGTRADAEAVLRLTRAGWRIERGGGWIDREVSSDPWSLARRQWMRADDSVIGAIHGRSWRRSLREAGWQIEANPPGHPAEAALLVAAGLVGLVAARNDRWRGAGAAAACWAAGTARLATTGALRNHMDVGKAVRAASLIPPAVLAATVTGVLRARKMVRSHRACQPRAPLGAVLFDRDGTLLVDARLNGDPAAVRPATGAARALERVRAAGLAVGLLDGDGWHGDHGRSSRERLLQHRVEALLGPFDVVEHSVARAARRLGLDPRRCAVVGDQGNDVAAGLAAGALAVLVPNGSTYGKDIRWAPDVAPTVDAAVDRLLEGASRPPD